MSATTTTTAAAPSAGLVALQLSCRGNPARERVLRDFVAFAEARGELAQLQALPRTPKGAAIDWLRLYEEVVARGGFELVTRRKLWGAIAARDCMALDLMPFTLALYYERVLFAFEAKQLFGRDVPPSAVPAKRATSNGAAVAMNDADARIATGSELQEAQNMGGTPLPPPPKRLKVQRSGHANADMGTLHGLVLALDSDLPAEVLRAVNLLSVLSFGNPNDADSDLLVDSVPGLLDALYRQLQQCALLPHQLFARELEDSSAQRARRRLLNVSEDVGQRELLNARGLLLLNILRNLSMVAENEKLLADHEEICVFLILLLRTIDQQRQPALHRGDSAATTNPEIGDHALDILCHISKRIDFVALHPPAKLELWHPQYQLAAHVWKKERVLPLECLLQQLARMLLQPQLKRSVLLRTCELFCNVCRDASVRHALASSETLRDPKLLDRVVGLLACARQDFASRKQQPPGGGGGVHVYEDYEMDDDEDDDLDDNDENSKWPAPWENDGHPSGVGMGVVYVSPEGNRSVGGGADSQIDHEVRDAALEVLFRMSDVGDDAKVSAQEERERLPFAGGTSALTWCGVVCLQLRMAKHPHCLFRVVSVLTSCIGRVRGALIAADAMSLS